MATAPAVVASAFAPTSESWATVCGSDADSPDPTNRPTPMINSAVMNRIGLGSLATIWMATMPTRAQRIRFAQTITRRRLQRSSSAPANGPMIEYGSSSTDETGGDLGRFGLPFRAEQHQDGQCALEGAVTERS